VKAGDVVGVFRRKAETARRALLAGKRKNNGGAYRQRRNKGRKREKMERNRRTRKGCADARFIAKNHTTRKKREFRSTPRGRFATSEEEIKKVKGEEDRVGSDKGGDIRKREGQHIARKSA